MSTDDINRARNFAIKAHGGQKYGDGLPYVHHLDRVYGKLVQFDVDEESLLVAAFLHDTIEDTNVTAEDIIYNGFGAAVAQLVSAVTNGPGKNRAERHANTYPKILACPGAVQLKLADRLANVEYSFVNQSPQLEMYRKEQAVFRAALYEEGVHSAMWKQLEKLLKADSKLLEVSRREGRMWVDENSKDS